MKQMEHVGDDLLSLIEAAEEDAIATVGSCKRRKLTGDDITRKDIEEEGSYMAALRGSRSSLWQRRQQEVGFQKKGSGGTSYGVGSRGSVPSSTMATGGGGDVCFKCGMSGHWARECGGGQGASTNRTDELGEDKPCPCGSGNCLILTSNTAKNPGRRFYRCPLKVENGGCNFFQWCDIPSSDISPSMMAYQSDTLPPVLRCPCGAGPCLSLVCKAGKNAGQQYYKCPGSEGKGCCGFFKWCDEPSSYPRQPTFSHQLHGYSNNHNSKIYADNGKSSCIKCGQEGHWAKACLNQSSDPIPQGVKNQCLNPGIGSCFKCGKAGHWARDCPAQSSIPSDAVGSAKRRFNSSQSSFNYKCK
ncbi:hypothetical protein HPP92_017732 [Vanilla planifolia]|uniref:Uncharacterized protein n=1 Tax=Vanilla planifolia TaxID=51239 RepID=A0A835QE98_VANPL|nr:hypothetical protein HPP92_017732 [Vanilla planifolia]